jgi:hypothetical protein
VPEIADSADRVGQGVERDGGCGPRPERRAEKLARESERYKRAGNKKFLRRRRDRGSLEEQAPRIVQYTKQLIGLN